MTRVDASLPEPLAALLVAAVEDGLFKGSSDAARTATRAYFDRNEDVRIEAVRALVAARAPGSETALSLADVVRLTGRPPADLPEDVRVVFDVDADQASEAEGESEEETKAKSAMETETETEAEVDRP